MTTTKQQLTKQSYESVEIPVTMSQCTGSSTNQETEENCCYNSHWDTKQECQLLLCSRLWQQVIHSLL